MGSSQPEREDGGGQVGPTCVKRKRKHDTALGVQSG